MILERKYLKRTVHSYFMHQETLEKYSNYTFEELFQVMLHKEHCKR